MEWKETKSDVTFWSPESIDDSLIGEVVAEKDGEYGKQWTIKKEDGLLALTPSHKVLQNRMAEVKLGDFVKIIFIGEENPKLKGHNKTKMYKVFIRN